MLFSLYLQSILFESVENKWWPFHTERALTRLCTQYFNTDILFNNARLLDKVENFLPPLLFLSDMQDLSAIQHPCEPFAIKWEMEKYICRHILCHEALPIFVTSPPRFILQLVLSEPGIAQSQWKNTQKEKDGPGLIKCLTVYISSQFISLSWVNTRWVRKRLLRAVTTTSKTKRTLQEEYEILIKPVRLRISSPPATKVGVALFSVPSSHSRPCHRTAPRQPPFSQ